MRETTAWHPNPRNQNLMGSSQESWLTNWTLIVVKSYMHEGVAGGGTYSYQIEHHIESDPPNLLSLLLRGNLVTIRWNPTSRTRLSCLCFISGRLSLQPESCQPQQPCASRVSRWRSPLRLHQGHFVGSIRCKYLFGWIHLQVGPRAPEI